MWTTIIILYTILMITYVLLGVVNVLDHAPNDVNEECDDSQ